MPGALVAPYPTAIALTHTHHSPSSPVPAGEYWQEVYQFAYIGRKVVHKDTKTNGIVVIKQCSSDYIPQDDDLFGVRSFVSQQQTAVNRAQCASGRLCKGGGASSSSDCRNRQTAAASTHNFR